MPMPMLPSFALIFLAASPSADFSGLTPAQQKQCREEAPAKIARLVSIDIEQAKRLTELAYTHTKGIVMRPIGVGAPKWRADGSSPKPLAIKWKTCNKVDLQIGGPAGCFGALVLFEPHQPVTWPTDKVLRSVMENRILQRDKEWKDAHADATVDWKIPNYTRFYDAAACDEHKPPTPDCMVLVGFRRDDGFVRDVKNGLPFTGDLDLFDVTDSKGRQLVGKDAYKQKIVKQLIAESGVDVLHPVHVDWSTEHYKDEYPDKYAYYENIRLPILDVHRERPQSSPKREPLVIVRADCSVCEVWAQPHANDPYAAAPAKAGLWTGAWDYPCITTPSEQIDRDSPRAANWNPKQANERPNLDHIPLAPLNFKKGKQLYIKPRPDSPDKDCFEITITQAKRYKDGTGAYSFTNKHGGASGDEAAYLESRVCAGPPAQSHELRMSVGTQLQIKSGPNSPSSDCFAITITKVTMYNDGTAAYEFKNSGGGVSGDDADDLEARVCH